MKKQIQFLGLIAAVLFLFGSVFKIQHYPGASILISLGSVLGAIYLILYLLNGINHLAPGLEKTSGIVGAIVLIIIILGFLFKMNHWPGGSIIVRLSLVGLFFSSGLMLIDAFKETDQIKQSLKSLASFTVFILMVILIFVTFLLNKPTT
jgi:hypothetical protein